MEKRKMNEQILKHIGGKQNIEDVTHCMTRLRISVKDTQKIQLKSLDAIDGVLGAVLKGNQVQLVIGNDINDVYADFNNLIGVLKNDGSAAKTAKGIVLQNIMNTIAAIFNPVVPALAGAGMIKALLVVLSLLKWIDKSGDTYLIINTLSDSVFTFLPFLLAYSSAKQFKSNPYLAVALAGTLMHPAFTGLRAEGIQSLKFLGIQMNLVNYASSVVPIVLGVLALSYIEKYINKFMPSALKIIFVPALTLLIGVPIVLLTVGPMAQFLGNLLASAVTTLFDKGGIFAGVIYGGIYSTMVVTGLHHGMVPVLVSAINTNGYNTISPASGSANMAQAGASFAVWLKSKNQKTKSVAAGASISALLGVTEPAIYGVNLRLKKPFLAAALGGAVGGGFAAAFGGRAYAMGGPSFATIAMFIGDDGGKWIYVLIAFMLAFIVAAIATLFIGFEEVPLEDDFEPEVVKHTIQEMSDMIASPVTGELVPLVDVQDSTFSSGMVGNGFAVMPSSNDIHAPVSGEIVSLFKTGHALGIQTSSGVEVLTHVGIDTVKLEGKGFELQVKVGDHVKQGDLLMRVDRQLIEAEGYSPITMVVVTNKEKFPNFAILDTLHVKHGDRVMGVSQ